MKNTLCTTIGAVGAYIAAWFGGWNSSLTALVVFMAIDYITGLIVAGVFKNSPKSKNGGLESKVGYKGLCKKCMILLFVLIGHQLDVVIGASYIRDAICIGFMANELISITENADAMGVPLPDVVKNAIGVLKSKSKDNKEEKEHDKN